MIGEFCIIRCRDAGVHMGYVREIAGRAVRLRESRRLWQWDSRFTLNEISVDGAGEDSRISQPVQDILLLEACEVIKCEPKAIANLTRSRNGV